MHRRPDSDIFGTKNLQTSVRIQNDSFVDPNEAFKKKNDENFEMYNSRVGNVGRKHVMEGNPEMTAVNENAKFGDDYHKTRKEKDLQSTIFYKQKQYPKPTSEESSQVKKPLIQNSEKACQNVNEAQTFGRKNTFKRQVESLPYNQSHMKGNESQLFDFDNSSRVKTSEASQRSHVQPLIPHQMQWCQHDSIRYNHCQREEESPFLGDSNLRMFNRVEESKSTEDPVEVEVREEEQKLMQKQTEEPKAEVAVEKPKKAVKEALNGDVEVRVLRGWDSKFMEGMSKYQKMYSTPMTKFQFQGPGKAIIFLKRTKRWEAVTDWLTKDAKMKLRIMNP